MLPTATSPYAAFITDVTVSHLNETHSWCSELIKLAYLQNGARLWNSLPPDIVACDILPPFRRELRTSLFRQSYPSILL